MESIEIEQEKTIPFLMKSK